ncbi:hypothetical protein DUNSADRAFT_2596, partial [Dunaliella salina]
MAAPSAQPAHEGGFATKLLRAAGLGSANIKHPLLAFLKLVHAKARKALAAHAAKRRISVALRRSQEGREEVNDCLESQDIESFDWEGTNGILERVRVALASLATAELAGQEATGFAEKAMVPILFEQQVLGASDEEDTPRQKSARALAQAMDATHRAYPEAADAVEKAAITVSLTMRTKLVQAEKAFMASRQAEENSKEAEKESKAAEQKMNSAREEIDTARDAVSRAEEALQKQIKHLALYQQTEDERKQELVEAQAMQKAAEGADEKTKKDKADVVSSAATSLEEATDVRVKGEAHRNKLQNDLDQARDGERQVSASAQEAADACNAKRAESGDALALAKQKKQDARMLSPNAGQEKGGDTVEQQLAR